MENIELMRRFNGTNAGKTDKFYVRYLNGEFQLVTETPDSKGCYVLMAEDKYYLVSVGNILIKPLAWKDNKPIYAGDTLYWQDANDEDKTVTFLVHGYRDDLGMPFLIGDSTFTNGLVMHGEDRTGMPLDELIWDKPKEKKSAWINIYPKARLVHVHQTKDEADKSADKARVACIQIHWEE